MDNNQQNINQEFPSQNESNYNTQPTQDNHENISNVASPEIKNPNTEIYRMLNMKNYGYIGQEPEVQNEKASNEESLNNETLPQTSIEANSNIEYTNNINPQSNENIIPSQTQNNFINKESNDQFQNPNTEINEMLNINTDNKFLSQKEFNETSLNDLNIEDGYNNIERTDYSQEPQVRANIDGQKKNTITITGEMKAFIIIALVLLIFVFAMPYIFDLIREIKY